MRRTTFLRVQVAGWVVYGLVHFLAALPAVSDAQRGDLAGWKVVRALTGLLVSSALPFLYRRLPGGLERLGVVLSKVLVVSYLASLLWASLDRALLLVVVASTRLEVDWSRFPRGFDLDYPVALLAWSGAYMAARFWAAAAEARRHALEQGLLAREAQVQTLALQLDPHFLFNTLNSLRGLIAEDAAAAREMVTQLAAFLRHGIQAGAWGSVREEIASAADYLAIERVRFEDRLQATVNADPLVEDWALPRRLLLPLVENAVKHGRPVGDAPVVQIAVSAHREGREGRRLLLEVASSGVLLAAEPGAGSGLGLANVQARLAHAFGAEQRFTLAARGDFVVASIEIDFPEEPSAARTAG
jgi:hypothetical protein